MWAMFGSCKFKFMIVCCHVQLLSFFLVPPLSHRAEHNSIKGTLLFLSALLLEGHLISRNPTNTIVSMAEFILQALLPTVGKKESAASADIAAAEGQPPSSTVVDVDFPSIVTPASAQQQQPNTTNINDGSSQTAAERRGFSESSDEELTRAWHEFRRICEKEKGE